MYGILNLDTVMLCTCLAMLAASLAMFIVWRNKPKERAAAYWAISFLLGALGFMTAAFAQTVLMPSVIFLVNFLLTTGSYVGIWFGFRAFNDKPPKFWPVLSVFGVWFAAYFLWPAFGTSPNIHAAAQSTIIAGFSLVCAYTVLNGPQSGKLPMALPTAILLLTHGIIHCGHLGILTHLISSDEPLGRTLWWSLAMLEVFIHNVSIAIACIILIKDRSEEQHRIAAETDALTGIYNRGAFVKKVDDHLANAEMNTSLAIFDLDHFKRINDRHGHQAGDAVLIAFAKRVKETLPKDAIFGRMGGEEFGLLLPAPAKGMHENICQLISSASIPFKGISIPLSVSVGVATVEDAGNNFDHLMAAADRALYRAKKGGRNRVTHFRLSDGLNQVLERDNENHPTGENATLAATYPA